MNPQAMHHVAERLPPRFSRTIRTFTLICLGLCACVASSSGPQKFQDDSRLFPLPDIAPVRAGQLEFVASTGSTADLQGTATIGGWKSHSTEIHGQVILDVNEKAVETMFDNIQAASKTDPNGTHAAPLSLPVRGTPIAAISLPVKSLRGSSSGMDSDMHKALKADQDPNITFSFRQLQQATVQWDAQDQLPGLKLRIDGDLTLAGVVRPITMDLIVARDSQGHFVVHAQTAMLMSDFGVTPPVALFGLIRAGNDVRVLFDLNFVLTDHSHNAR